MEQLPNEIWLIVFNYLNQLDVFYAFSDLNLRFQHLMILYTGLNIDLTNVSYKLYKWFIEHVLSTEGFKIHSLSIKKFYQIKILKDNIVQLSSLKSLKWKWLSYRDYRKYSESDIDYCISKLQNFPHLIHLHIYGDFNPFQMLAMIALNTPLTSLTLLSSDCRRIMALKWNPDSVRLPSVKILTINLEYLHQLSSVLLIVNNIEELNLSVINLTEMIHLLIPKSLVKFHFEFAGKFRTYYRDDPLRSEILQTFLNNFKNQLNSLTLMLSIIPGDYRPFVKVSELQNFMETFPGLRTKCQYLIRTNEFPLLTQTTNVDYLVEQLSDGTHLIYTNPCPRSFNNTKFRDIDASIDSSSIDSKLARRFDHETSTLSFSTDNSLQIINQLSLITNPLNSIAKLKCQSTTPFDGLFIIELAKIVPNLKSLYLLNGISLLPTATQLKPMVAIDHVQQYFLNVIDFGLFMKVKNRHEKFEFEELKRWIKLKRYDNDSQPDDIFYVEYSSENNDAWFIKFWF